MTSHSEKSFAVTRRPSFKFDIPLKPKAKGRPRKGKHGFYTDKATKEYEEAVGLAYLAAGGKKFDGNVMISVTFMKERMHVVITSVKEESSLRGDLDNYLKSLLDGLNGIAYEDDGQVVNIRAFKR